MQSIKELVETFESSNKTTEIDRIKKLGGFLESEVERLPLEEDFSKKVTTQATRFARNVVRLTLIRNVYDAGYEKYLPDPNKVSSATIQEGEDKGLPVFAIFDTAGKPYFEIFGSFDGYFAPYISFNDVYLQPFYDGYNSNDELIKRMCQRRGIFRRRWVEKICMYFGGGIPKETTEKIVKAKKTELFAKYLIILQVADWGEMQLSMDAAVIVGYNHLGLWLIDTLTPLTNVDSLLPSG